MFSKVLLVDSTILIPWVVGGDFFVVNHELCSEDDNCFVNKMSSLVKYEFHWASKVNDYSFIEKLTITKIVFVVKAFAFTHFVA